MKAYILCFLASIFFIIFAERCLKKEKKVLGIIFIIFSMMTICFIAGVRDYYTGADITVYVTKLFKLYANEGYSFFMVEASTRIEPFFSLLVMISSIFKDLNVVLFMIEFACAIPIFIYAYKVRKEYSMVFILIIFLFTMFARSLNLMRQFIAISIIILSVYYFYNKKYRMAFLLFFMAIMTHYTAIIAVVIYVIIYINTNIRNIKTKNFLNLLVIGGLLFFVFGIDKIVVILPSKYTAYFDSKYAVSVFSFFSLLKKFFWISLSFILVSKIKKDDNSFNLQKSAFIFFIIDLIMYFLSLKVGTFGRISYYFLYIAYFIMIPQFSKIFKQKVIINCLIVVVLFLFWYNMTVINYNADRTYPFNSEIVKFLNDNKGADDI